MGTKLYVGNLNFQTQDFDIREHFSAYGEVVSASIVTDRDTGRSRGFGFVEMASEEDARKAEEALNGKELDGRQLKVNEAHSKGPGGGDRRDRW